MKARLAEEWAVFLLALQFLTRLPLPADPGHSPARVAASPRWYPAVGALVGAAAALVYWLAALGLPPLLAVLLSTAAGILVTGALHEDGFADVCDGLGGGATRERALEIMRDSRLGTYGALGLGLMLAGKVAALAALAAAASPAAPPAALSPGALPAAALPVAALPLALVAGHAASRASAVLVLATSSYVRAQGAGRPVAGGLAPGGLAVALATGAAAVALAGLAVPATALAGGVSGLAAGHLAMRARFERRLGGYTGDCLGAVQQMSELGFYLGLVACL